MLMTVRDACRPRANVLRADPEPDIEDIAEVIKAAEQDAEAFFARNHVTGGMRQLFELGIARPTAGATRRSTRSRRPWAAGSRT